MNDIQQQPVSNKPKSRKGLYLVIAVVVVIAVAVVGFVLLNRGSSESATTSEGNTVRYTADGFRPGNIRIKAGETVTWKNETSSAITVDSNPHPVHMSYRPLNLGRIEPDAEQRLTFDTAGTYNYHNHLKPFKQGTVTVE